MRRMEKICFSGTLVSTVESALRHNSEQQHRQLRRREDLTKSRGCMASYEELIQSVQRLTTD
jgi:hypothetical protein